jgi:hypothetical protein
LRVDETTNEDTAEPLVNTSERIHSCVRVRLVCGGLGSDDNSLWGCEALLGTGDKQRDEKEGVGRWRLERGSGLSEAEEREVRVGWEMGPRELRLMPEAGSEYPAEVLYPVGEEDHKWRWVFDGQVEGEGEGRVPHVMALPEEPLVGYWERYLLGLMVGEADVWRYAQKGIKA